MTSHPRWRCVLLSGPTGSGKTTACRLGYSAMADAWGHPAAAIDTDQLYFNVDARFELAYDGARDAMVLSQAADRPGSHRTRELMRASGIPARPCWTIRP
ncbi:MAG: hypothetical protein ACRDNO_10525 [Trebonia sp.]